MGNDDRKIKSLREVLENAPKTLNKEYLQILYTTLFHHKLEPDVNLEDIISSLLLIVIDGSAPVSLRHFAIVILQKLSPLKGVSEVINFEDGSQLVHSLPVVLMQDFMECGIDGVIRNLILCLCRGNWPVEFHCQLLAFSSKAIASSKLLLSQEDLDKISSLLSQWLIIPATVPTIRPQGFRRSPSLLSITEIDGTDTQDFFTVLNYVSTINPVQFRNIQVFSMMKSYLTHSNKKVGKGSKQTLTFMGGNSLENLSHSLREYCMRIIDQVDRRVQSASIAEFQKACLVEAIDLFDILCLMDSGIIHTIFPIIRRIYDHVHSNVYSDPEVQDVAVMASAMRFFINHGSSVMHKPDNLYVYMFCDLLSMSYKDNYISFEILQLMKENLSQLCYHSSILEKYFPTFFKVLAWRPNTFLNDFLELLPAFMSQHTSVEVFYMLLDLPCLTAILLLTDNKSNFLDSKAVKDPTLLEALRKPEVTSMVKFMLRKNSGIGDTFESVSLLHQSLSSLASDSRVLCCAEAVIPLLKKYFKVLLQYADTSVSALLIPTILERLSILYPVPKYADEVHNVLSSAVVQLFELHPETIFHCQKTIMTYINHFKNYFIARQNFIHMIWIIGEYISVAYSSMCRPEVIAVFFESLESTTYESLSYLQESSDDCFLKLLSIALTTLSKLAARNQDQVPRAVLCLSKAHQQLSSFGNDYKKNWKIVMERVLELLSILNSPNVAAIVLSPPKQLEYGRLHRDSTSLPYVLRAITRVVTTDI